DGDRVAGDVDAEARGGDLARGRAGRLPAPRGSHYAHVTLASDGDAHARHELAPLATRQIRHRHDDRIAVATGRIAIDLGDLDAGAAWVEPELHFRSDGSLDRLELACEDCVEVARIPHVVVRAAPCVGDGFHEVLVVIDAEADR